MQITNLLGVILKIHFFGAKIQLLNTENELEFYYFLEPPHLNMLSLSIDKTRVVID